MRAIIAAVERYKCICRRQPTLRSERRLMRTSFGAQLETGDNSFNYTIPLSAAPPEN